MGAIYTQLSYQERRRIEDWWLAKVPVSERARVLKRHKSTIFREIKRNFWVDDSLPKKYAGYFGMAAHQRTQQRRSTQRKLIRHPDLCKRVIERIKQGWTPEQIGNRMIYEGDKLRVCQETIYRYIYSKEGMDQELWWYLPLHRKNRTPRRARKRQKPNFDRDVSILFRPDDVAHRRQFGHWEGDLMLFEQKRGQTNVTSPERRVDAVQNASLDIAPGETVALIGESGSGKSTLARAVMRLVPAQRGEIVFDDTDLLSISQREMRPFRNEMSMMLQDPIGSLSPRMPVGTSVIEPIIVSGSSRGKNLRHEAIKLLEMVGLSEDFADRYPHEMSGGQARRVGVARALALRPKLVIADEPTAGLDVSIQGEIFNLLAELRETMSLSILIITHNLHVVRHLADRMVIMYHGEIVETGLTEDVVRAPQHNYTRELLAANLHAKYGTNS